MTVLVPAGLPCAGQPAKFTVPPGSSGGQQIRVPLPAMSGGAAGPQQGAGAPAPGCFRVQLPAVFSAQQVLQVTVPHGYPQAGQPVRFKVPHAMQGGDMIDVPLPPVTTIIPVPGHFRVQLPPTISGGQLLTVTVPAGYVEAGRTQTFRVPVNAVAGGFVDVPLPSGGPHRPGVYDAPAPGVAASSASDPVRGVVVTGDNGGAARDRQPDTRLADPPTKSYNV